ncbi:hypothetical protein BECAL_00638, partial [Bellilinea caldifistulae]
EEGIDGAWDFCEPGMVYFLMLTFIDITTKK